MAKATNRSGESGEGKPTTPTHAMADLWSQIRRPVGVFLGRFALIMLLLSIPWPGLKSLYGEIFRSVAGYVGQALGDRTIVLFRVMPSQGNSPVDTSLNVGDRQQLEPNGSLPTVSQEFATRYVGYLPTVMVLSLVLATPLPWRRRAWALLWGMVWVHVFIAFQLLVMLLYLCNHTEWLPLYKLGPLLVKVVDGAWDIFIYQVVARHIVPVLIWILVTFRTGDMEQMLGVGEASLPRAKARRDVR